MPKLKQRDIEGEEVIGLGLRIKQSLHEKIKQQSFNQSKSINMIVEDAIIEYIKRKEKNVS